MNKANEMMVLTVLMVAFGFVRLAHSAPIVLSYDSFEDPNILPATSVDEPEPTGWFDSGHPNTAGIIHETHNGGTFFSTPYGEQALKVWQGNQEGAKKNLTAVLEADSSYSISFNATPRDGRQVGDYRAELWVNGVLLDSVEGKVSANDMSESVLHTFDTSGGVIGGAMQLRLVDPASGQVTSAWQDGPYYDNVQLVKDVIPEPASLGLLGLGGLMLFKRRGN